MNPSKSQLAAKNQAAKNVEPYDKRITTHVKACPFCDKKIDSPTGFRNANLYVCQCGAWKVNIYGEWSYFNVEQEESKKKGE